MSTERMERMNITSEEEGQRKWRRRTAASHVQEYRAFAFSSYFDELWVPQQACYFEPEKSNGVNVVDCSCQPQNPTDS